MIEVILLERIERLGQMGDVVKVRPGYARNFLLPQKKALRATKDNMAYYEQQKAALQAQNAARRTEAEKTAQKIDGLKLVLVRQASDTSQLYGSVTARDVSDALKEQGHSVDKGKVIINEPIKILGLHNIRVALHPELIVAITVNVARSVEEAEVQASGKAVLAKKLEDGETSSEESAQILQEQPAA